MPLTPQVAVVVRAFVGAGGTVSSVPFARLVKLVISGSKLMQEAQVPDAEWDWNLEVRTIASILRELKRMFEAALFHVEITAPVDSWSLDSTSLALPPAFLLTHGN